MKRIISLMKFDLTNALRDSMVIYILAAPLLLAFGLRAFLPSFEGAEVTYAVEVPAGGAGLVSARAPLRPSRTPPRGRIPRADRRTTTSGDMSSILMRILPGRSCSRAMKGRRARP